MKPTRIMWTGRMDAVIRAGHKARRTPAAIAARLGVSRGAVLQRARRIGVGTFDFERWTAAELDRLRDLYPTHSAARIAAVLGRTVSGVCHTARRLGLTGTKRPMFPASVLRRVKALNKAGRCDREIAEAMPSAFKAGVGGVYQVKGIRKRHGLPHHPDRDARRRSLESQRKTLGIRDSSQLRRLAHARFAESYGLPAGLTARAVQIVLALLDGPMTRRQLAERIGMRSHANQRRLLSGNSNGGSYTAELRSRGLVAYVFRSKAGRAKGRRLPGLYMLTGHALELLAAHQGGKCDGRERPGEPGLPAHPLRGDAGEGPAGRGERGRPGVGRR